MDATPTFASWLADWLQHAEPGTRLPTQRALAREWHLSPTTVARLLRPAIAGGRLRSAPGLGMVVSYPVEVGGAATPGRGSAAALARLVDDITAGRLRHGDRLPSQRDLAVRFGAGRASVAAALREMATRGLVRRQGRHLVVGGGGRAADAAPASEMLLVADPDDLARDRWRELWTHLEDELLRVGVRLRREPRDRRDALLDDLSAGPCRVRGVIVVEWSTVVPEPLLAAWRRLLRRDPRGATRLLVLGSRLGKKRRPERCDLLTHGSFHTQVARQAVALGARMSPDEVFLVQDGNHPRRLKNLLRLVPELEHRLPATRWRFLVHRPARGGDGPSYLREVLAGDPVGTDYFQGLLGQYRQGNLAELAQRFASVDDLATLRFPPRSLVLTEHAPLAMAIAAAAAGQGRVLGEDLGLLSLRDDPACLAAGIGVCAPDWRGTGHAVAHALLADLPVARTSQGYLRPLVRCATRGSLPLG